jgi:hypothetical protein
MVPVELQFIQIQARSLRDNAHIKNANYLEDELTSLLNQIKPFAKKIQSGERVGRGYKEVFFDTYLNLENCRHILESKVTIPGWINAVFNFLNQVLEKHTGYRIPDSVLPSLNPARKHTLPSLSNPPVPQERPLPSTLVPQRSGQQNFVTFQRVQSQITPSRKPTICPCGRAPYSFKNDSCQFCNNKFCTKQF